jgi:BCD family chlorophyll transporter-like MFS transporter
VLLAVLAYALVGAGVGACGTSLLVLLAQRVEPARRAAASAIVWIMMIVGFIVTAGTVGAVLDPFTFERLIAVTAVVGAAAVLLTVLAVMGVEGRVDRATAAAAPERPESASFREAFLQVWREPRVRRFATFVFISMLAYSAQDLILEPFAGIVFGMTPGETTQLAGLQNGGVLCGMILVALVGRGAGGRSMRPWTAAGCVGSAVALLGLGAAALVGPAWPLKPTVFALGVANGVFAIAAIAAMMGLVSEGRASREGVRMGMWGAAQALAFGGGGFLGTVFIDAGQWLFGAPFLAYAFVFACEAALFLCAARLALRVAGARGAEPVAAVRRPSFAWRTATERR